MLDYTTKTVTINCSMTSGNMCVTQAGFLPNFSYILLCFPIVTETYELAIFKNKNLRQKTVFVCLKCICFVFIFEECVARHKIPKLKLISFHLLRTWSHHSDLYCYGLKPLPTNGHHQGMSPPRVTHLMSKLMFTGALWLLIITQNACRSIKL